MAYFMVNFMVKRIPSTEYKIESFTCDSVHQTVAMVALKLQNDKSIIDFYRVF
jgi:hypothetical protein